MARTARRTRSNGLSSPDVRFNPRSPATSATMHDEPLAIAVGRDTQRLHERAAVRRTVTGRIVDVPAPQASRAVVAMSRSGCDERNARMAVAAGECGSSSGGWVVAPVARHGVPPRGCRTETAPRVPPVNARPIQDVIRSCDAGFDTRTRISAGTVVITHPPSLGTRAVCRGSPPAASGFRFVTDRVESSPRTGLDDHRVRRMDGTPRCRSGRHITVLRWMFGALFCARHELRIPASWVAGPVKVADRARREAQRRRPVPAPVERPRRAGLARRTRHCPGPSG